MPDPLSVALSVDALTPRLTGIGRYCLELSRGLKRADGIRQIAYFRGDNWFADPELLLQEHWQPPGRRWQRRLTDWRAHRKARRSIVHAPNYFLPSWAQTGIVTVHDLSVLLYPETHPIERVKDFERRFQQTLDRASAVITDSETVRHEVIDTLGIPPQQVFAVPLGIAKPTADNPRFQLDLAEHGLRVDGYTLCVSTFEPRKRIDRLVEAYAALPADLRQAYPLVLVGASGWRNDALNERIAAAQSAGWLKRLDYVADDVRDALYRGARLFVYPSLYEGFGLPPLEAMLHGVPTIIGNAATLIEVTQGAARVSEVEDRTSFAADLAECLQDDCWRKTAGTAGQGVAERYTWAQCAEQTVAVYRHVAGR